MLPKDAKGIVELITREYDYSTNELAHLMRISPRTINRILKGNKPLPGTYTHLIRLYFTITQHPNYL